MDALSALVSLPPGPDREGFLTILKGLAPQARIRVASDEDALRELASGHYDIVVAEARPGRKRSDILVIASRTAPRTARILVASGRPPTGALEHAHAVLAPPFRGIAQRSVAGILGLVMYYRSLPVDRQVALTE